MTRIQNSLPLSVPLRHDVGTNQGRDFNSCSVLKGRPVRPFLALVSLVQVFISFGGFKECSLVWPFSHFIFSYGLQGMFSSLSLIISQITNEFIKTSVQQV
ncbi:lipid phosphate phosphatase gamma, chloroplastic [Quillaja saponaria]|uniref:Lipid phosphate phosphatase gamma, chloroplastic n=1 Tax=Quillaja saponaria TaxID=32244 RepID=A0AAD7KWX6_QUISA|nr:lipid phosphate phosphatase gamma, chloroplastic [Quillaja saponaria]